MANMDISVDALLTGRPSETAIASYRRRLTPDEDVLDWSCPEHLGGGLSLAVPGVGDDPIVVPMGTILKGRFLFILASAAIDVYINGDTTDPIKARFLMLESDTTTGITSVHVKNTSGSVATLEYLIGGDLVITP